MNKESESLILNKFFQGMKINIEQCKIVNCESPDFVCDINSQKIGIELVELVRNDSNTKHVSLCNKLIKQIKDILKNKSNLSPMKITFEIFDDEIHKNINKNNEINIVNSAISYIENICHKGYGEIIHQSGTPFMINVSKIQKQPNQYSTVVLSNKNYDFTEEILRIVQKKEAKIKSYKNNETCCKYWLLIYYDTDGKSLFFFNTNFNMKINSNFDKIYAYDYLKQNIISVK